MSYIFLQESGEVSSAEYFADIPAYALLKSIPIADPVCSKGRGMEYFHDSPSGMTYALSTAGHGGNEWTWLREDFPASMCLLPGLTTGPMEKYWVWMENIAAYGQRCEGLLKRCNLELSGWKTPHALELADLSESSKTLMGWGLMHDGVCWGFADSVRTKSEKGFSSLLPTPTAHNSKEGAYPAEYMRNTPTLAAQIGGKISPAWNEWRMGYPDNFSDCEPLEMEKFRQWEHLHGVYSVHDIKLTPQEKGLR